MALVLYTFAGLHILYWLASIAIPILLTILALACRLAIRQINRRCTAPLIDLARQVDRLDTRSLDNLAEIRAQVDQTLPGRAAEAMANLARDSQQLYQGRWLPDPRDYLRRTTLLSHAQQNLLSYRPAGAILAIGLLCALVTLVVEQALPPLYPELALGLILLPIALTGMTALLLAAAARTARVHLAEALDDLVHALGRHLPVYSDQTGTAALIDTFLIYDRSMKESLQAFTETAGRLAESDMADGIRRSIEQVLTESVAPSLQQSTAALSQLAGELSQRQERGMEELASRFAQALSAELAAHLHPVNRELAQMVSLMSDVKNYVDVAMRALETVHDRSGQLLQDVGQSLQEMAVARGTLTGDLAAIETHLTTLADTSSHMADQYSGQEQTLAGSLDEFGFKLTEAVAGLESTLQQTVRAAEDARLTAADHRAAAERHVSLMQEQVKRFGDQLKVDLAQLLEQIRQETGQVAGQSAAISRQVGQMNEILGGTLDSFTQGSAQYVKQTLSRFDEHLAEIFTRLAQTTSEIQDAVDALPAALQQQGPSYGA
jgi:hypothetical protein